MNIDEQYLNLLNELLEKYKNDKTIREDRTGVGLAASVFGRTLRFPVSCDSFPILTTKKVLWRGVIGELLWFLSGSTDLKDLRNYGVNFWDSWAMEDDTIGDGYGKQFRSIRYCKLIKPKVYELPKKHKNIVFEKVDPKFETDTKKTAYKVGQIITSELSGDWIVIEEKKNSTGRSYWILQSLDNGYVGSYTYAKILRGHIKNPYQRTVFDVGYYGEMGGINKKTEIYSVLVNTWRDMIRRCYYKKSLSYKSYGAKGIHVDEEWHNFTNFFYDVQKIPGWFKKLEHVADFSLDKDILYAANKYSKETCIWASSEEQMLNTTQLMPFSALSPEGNLENFASIGEMVRKYNLNLSAIHRCLNGKLNKHKNWTKFQYHNIPKGYVARFRIIDQVQELVCGLKHNSNSRRHIISLWNAHDIDYMALPPCHGNIIQFYVDSCGGLSLSVYQRSADVFLGLPVNLSSYSTLLVIISQLTGHAPKELVYHLGDLHLYSNHIEQAQTQVLRSVDKYEYPQLKINSNVKNIDDFKFEDFELLNYESSPFIKAPVAV